MEYTRIIYAVLFACMFSLNSRATAQNLQVLVLDAIDGKPQATVEVEYFCTRPQHNSVSKFALTTKEGLAMFPNPCTFEEDIEIEVYPSDKKEQCGVGPATLKTILSNGFVAQPDAAGGIWCPNKISKTLIPVPGRITMFIKKPTWWQSHVAG